MTKADGAPLKKLSRIEKLDALYPMTDFGFIPLMREPAHCYWILLKTPRQQYSDHFHTGAGKKMA